MGIINALLIRAAYGWDAADHEASQTAHGRREALYGLGSYSSPVDVARVAAARLELIAEPRYQYDAQQAPGVPEAETAYSGYTVGDSIPVTAPGGAPSSERVVSISVSEDTDTGRAVVSPTLNDVVLYASPVENFVALLAQAAKKMIPGTGRGDWVEAQPVTPPSVPQMSRGLTSVLSGWTELTPPPSLNGTPNLAVALDDGTILIGEGDGNPSTFWIYDPVTDSYTATASGPAGAAYNNLNAGAFVNGKAYAVSDPSTGTARYDGASWTTRAARSPQFANVSAATDGTLLYTLDGAENFQSYDPGANAWSTLSSPSVGYGYDPLICDGTSLWVFSGLSGVTQYDIGTDTWGGLLTDPPTPRSFVACGIIGGSAYLAGGIDGSSNPSDVLEIYDLAGDSWTTGAPMLTALTTAAGAVQDGKLYVFGLTGSPSFTPTARVYTP